MRGKAIIEPGGRGQQSVAEELIQALSRPKPGPTSSKPGPTSSKPGPTSSKPGPTSSKPGPASSKLGGSTATRQQEISCSTTVKLSNRAKFPSKSAASKVNSDWIDFLKKKEDGNTPFQGEPDEDDDSIQEITIDAVTESLPKAVLKQTKRNPRNLNKENHTKVVPTKAVNNGEIVEKEAALEQLMGQVGQLEATLGANITMLEQQLGQEKGRNKDLSDKLDREKEKCSNAGSKLISVQQANATMDKEYRAEQAEFEEKLKRHIEENCALEEQASKQKAEFLTVQGLNEKLQEEVQILENWRADALKKVKGVLKICKENHTEKIEALELQIKHKDKLFLEMKYRVEGFITETSELVKSKETHIEEMKQLNFDHEKKIKENEARLKDVESKLREKILEEARLKKKLVRNQGRGDGETAKDQRIIELNTKLTDSLKQVEELEKKSVESEKKVKQKEEEMIKVYDLVNELQLKMRKEKNSLSRGVCQELFSFGRVTPKLQSSPLVKRKPSELPIEIPGKTEGNSTLKTSLLNDSGSFEITKRKYENKEIKTRKRPKLSDKEIVLLDVDDDEDDDVVEIMEVNPFTEFKAVKVISTANETEKNSVKLKEAVKTLINEERIKKVPAKDQTTFDAVETVEAAEMLLLPEPVPLQGFKNELTEKRSKTSFFCSTNLKTQDLKAGTSEGKHETLDETCEADDSNSSFVCQEIQWKLRRWPNLPERLSSQLRFAGSVSTAEPADPRLARRETPQLMLSYHWPVMEFRNNVTVEERIQNIKEQEETNIRLLYDDLDSFGEEESLMELNTSNDDLIFSSSQKRKTWEMVSVQDEEVKEDSKRRRKEEEPSLPNSSISSFASEPGLLVMAEVDVEGEDAVEDKNSSEQRRREETSLQDNSFSSLSSGCETLVIVEMEAEYEDCEEVETEEGTKGEELKELCRKIFSEIFENVLTMRATETEDGKKVISDILEDLLDLVSKSASFPAQQLISEMLGIVVSES